MDTSEINESCLNHIKLHDACRNDIEKRCPQNPFTDYVTVCLTEWAGDVLEKDCADAIPKKEAKKEKVLSAEAKKRAAARRK